MKLKNKILDRAFQLDEVKTIESNEENKILEMSFSSEFPVSRGEGIREILLHNPGNVELERLIISGQLLDNHNTEKVHGKVLNAWLENKKGYVRIKFSRKEKSKEFFLDIVDKKTTNLSLKYEIKDYEIVERGEEEYDIIVKKWEPSEVSIVSIPADITVGVFRSIIDNNSENKNLNFKGKRNMDVEIKKNTTNDEIEKYKKSIESEVRAKLEKDFALETQRQKDIRDIAFNMKDFNLEGDEDINKIAKRFIDEKLPASGFANLVSSKLGKPKTLEPVGLSRSDIEDYGFTHLFRIMSGLSHFGSKRDVYLQEKLNDVVNATRSKLGRPDQAFPIPYEILQAKRVFGSTTVGSSSGSSGYVTNATGSNLIATNTLFGQFIDHLYNQLVFTQMGAQKLSGLVGNISIPKRTSQGTYTWYQESDNSTVAETNYTGIQSTTPNFTSVTMSPKTVSPVYLLSRQQLLQQGLSSESIFQADMTEILLLALEKAIVYGGTAKGDAASPYGIIYRKLAAGGSALTSKNTSSTPAVSITWDDVVALETALGVNNVFYGKPAYLTNSTGVGRLKTTKKDDYVSNFILENGSMNNLEVFSSNMIDNTFTDHTNSTATNTLLFLLLAKDILIGEWGGLEFIMDPYTKANQGILVVTAMKSLDVNIRRHESIQYIDEWNA